MKSRDYIALFRLITPVEGEYAFNWLKRASESGLLIADELQELRFYFRNKTEYIWKDSQFIYIDCDND
jgi:hypothetical protein